MPLVIGISTYPIWRVNGHSSTTSILDIIFTPQKITSVLFKTGEEIFDRFTPPMANKPPWGLWAGGRWQLFHKRSLRCIHERLHDIFVHIVKIHLLWFE